MDDIEPVDVTVVGDTGNECDVTVRLRNATATVGELAAALDWPAGPLAVDGVVVAATAPLVTSGLRRGSVVTVRRRPARRPDRAAAVLRWTGGVDAGRSVALAAGTTVIGRARDAHVRCRDPRVAPYECLVHVGADGWWVEPLAAAAPPPGSRWRVGARHAELAEPDDHPVAARSDPAPPGRWTVPCHRPPRPPGAAAPLPVRVPRLTARAFRPAPGGAGPVAALLAAAGSAVGAVVLAQPAFLLLGGLGAIGGLVSWVLERGAGRRAARTGRRQDRIALASFTAALGAQAEAVRSARWARAVELPAAVARAETGDARLWERRPHHDDFLEVVLGVGTVSWRPGADGLDDEPPAGIVAALAEHDRLIDVPVTVALRPGTVVGLVGDVVAARAVARSLVVQLAVGSGPADLSIVVGATTAEWEWTRWLPHRDADGAAAHVVIVDGDGTAGSLDSAAAGIVLAADVLTLPSSCTHVVTVGADADLSLLDLATGATVGGVVGAGASVATATGVARAVARYEDPELRRPGGDLPLAVDLGRLLGPGAFDGEAVAAAWAGLPADPPLRAPIGLGGDGPVEIDLVEDGPHALVAGTTGSGKSELLRSLVAGLAARCSPEHLAFVLVDYKGGSAFDACAALPHVAAVVTDLDGRLAARALRSLEAELRRRERLLRAGAAADLVAFRRAGGRLPRLVIVVDEMAGLAAELPDFVPALVGVAQRGRSLGLHLVLATQRPAGVVTDDIRANTNLRIALRVQTAAESHDVLGRPDAAELPGDRPGRAVLRRGPDDITVVQVAHTGGGAAAAGRPAVEVRPVGAGRVADDRPAAGRSAVGGPTTLSRLVDTLGDAARRQARPPVAPPWLPPLPVALALDDLPPGAVALADDPDHQAQPAVSWTDGNLLCLGAAGSGTTAALASLAVVLAGVVPPSARHLYVVDMGAGGLGALALLPHAAVVTAADRERQARLVHRLHAEVERRRAEPAGEGTPEIVLLVDGLPALRAAFDDPAGFAVLDALDQVITGGAALGVRVAATADRAGALPVAVLAGFGRRWTFRALDGPPLPPGRAVDGDTGWEVQIATPRVPLTEVGAELARRWPAGGGPGPIGVLPTAVPATALSPPSVGPDRWTVPVGIADTDLGPAALVLHPGDHVFIGGRSRTGRSSALVVLAQRLRAAAPADLLVAALALRPSPLTDAGAELVVSDPAGLPALAVLGSARRPAVLLVDDADRVDDDGTLAGLVATGGSRLHVVAAGRPDVLRSLYGHWTATLRRSRLGVLLQPDVDVDGDLLGTVLPRRPTVAAVAPVPGRGYLVVDGRAELVQLAAPANMGA